jgi:hypothetical protein
MTTYPIGASTARHDAKKSKWMLGGLAVLLALWLGLTAPAQSPVAPTPSPVTSAQSLVIPAQSPGTLVQSLVTLATAAPAAGVAYVPPPAVSALPAPHRRR